MPKLFSSDFIEKVLQKKGFVFVSQKGSHKKFRKEIASIIFTVIVPANKREIPIGTFRSILRQSRLSFEDFK
jgi:predicted RNA binding protein YcfA (HicA-like mRNA interferase family)